MAVQTIGDIAGLRARVCAAKRSGERVACVPTMGALHAGHGALIDRARAESHMVVITIFVNPLQFDREDDYERYSRQLDADRDVCEARGADLIFAPTAAEMYPEQPSAFVDVPELARHLCGEFRPGHFRGVATVVAKLFNIVQPDAAYFGEKDAQQLAIIRRMVRDLDFPIEIVPVATVREPDGLALSSRNGRLSPSERRVAPLIFQALEEGRRLVDSGVRDSSVVKEAIRRVLAAQGMIRLEYVEAVDAAMQPVETIGAGSRLVIAAWLGGVRLIDNVVCRV
jgi:pantoate--beta-alanine ligase